MEGQTVKDIINNTNNLRPEHEIGRTYDGGMLDITGAKDVEVAISGENITGKVFWINVDGVCVLRICRIKGDVQIVRG